jgi:hypothetical protein
MKILIINTHLTYQGWSEGKLKLHVYGNRKDVLCRARATMTNQNSYRYR